MAYLGWCSAIAWRASRPASSPTWSCLTQSMCSSPRSMGSDQISVRRPIPNPKAWSRTWLATCNATCWCRPNWRGRGPIWQQPTPRRKRGVPRSTAGLTARRSPYQGSGYRPNKACFERCHCCGLHCDEASCAKWIAWAWCVLAQDGTRCLRSTSVSRWRSSRTKIWS